MDALMDHQDAVDDCVAQLLRPLIDEQLSVVFYDLTTIRVEGLSQQSGDVRKFGMSKEGVVARQFMLGVVQTADGLPIYHEVFDGNASEGPTLKPTLERVLQRYPHVRRLVVVADRGCFRRTTFKCSASSSCRMRARWSSSWPCPGAGMATSSSCSRRCRPGRNPPRPR